MLTDVVEIKRVLKTRSSLLALAACVLGGCVYRAPETGRAPILIEPAATSHEPESATVQWPGWRGGDLQGVSPCPNLPTKWSSSEGLRWRVDVPGQGNSSPVVWDQHVYLTSQLTADGVDEVVLLCLDRRSGRRLWQSSLGTVRGPTHQKNGYASSTVATDGDHIVALAGSRRLHCFDSSGMELWRIEFPTLRHQWGLAASPIIFRNLAIAVCDGQPQSFVVAIDLDTGREVWRTGRQSQGCWSTPVISETMIGGAGRFELIVNGTSHADGSAGYVSAYDPQTGAALWQTPCTTDIPCPTAIVTDGLIVSTSGGNGPIVAIRPGGSGDVRDTHVAWQHSNGGPYVPTGVAYQNRLFVVTDSGRLTCYDLADGRPVWKQRLSGTFTASLVAGDGKIYATNERGEVYVLRAADRFELIAVNSLDRRCLATPAIAHGEFFFRTESSLFCVKGTRETHVDQSAADGQLQTQTVRSMSDLDSVNTPEPSSAGSK